MCLCIRGQQCEPALIKAVALTLETEGSVLSERRTPILAAMFLHGMPENKAGGGTE